MDIEAQLVRGATLAMELMTKRVMVLDVLCAALAVWSIRAAAARLAKVRQAKAKPKGRQKVLAAIYSPKQFRRDRRPWD